MIVRTLAKNWTCPNKLHKHIPKLKSYWKQPVTVQFTGGVFTTVECMDLFVICAPSSDYNSKLHVSKGLMNAHISELMLKFDSCSLKQHISPLSARGKDYWQKLNAIDPDTILNLLVVPIVIRLDHCHEYWDKAISFAASDSQWRQIADGHTTLPVAGPEVTADIFILKLIHSKWVIFHCFPTGC